MKKKKKKRSEELKQQLEKRGYNQTLICKQISKASKIKRQEALKYRKKNQNSNRVPLVVTYLPDLPKLNQLMKKHWLIIKAHPRLQKALPELPIISYRCPPNLRDHLVRAQVSTKQSKHNSTQSKPTSEPCKKLRCKNCQNMLTTSTFCSYITGQSFEIKHNANCLTTNVVYLIQCAKCGIQ